MWRALNGKEPCAYPEPFGVRKPCLRLVRRQPCCRRLVQSLPTGQSSRASTACPKKGGSMAAAIQGLARGQTGGTWRHAHVTQAISGVWNSTMKARFIAAAYPTTTKRGPLFVADRKQQAGRAARRGRRALPLSSQQGIKKRTSAMAPMRAHEGARAPRKRRRP